MQIVALPFEESMLFNMEDNVEVTGRSAEGAGFAESRKADARAVFYTCGNFGFDRALAQQSALAFALRTRIGDHASGTLTCGTGAGDAEKPLLITNLTAAIAGAALYGRFAGRGTRTATRIARFMTADFDVLLYSEEGFFKFQIQVFAQVGAALSPGAPTPSSTEEVAEAEKFSEDVTEILEDGGIETGRAARCAPHTGVSKAVVK